MYASIEHELRFYIHQSMHQSFCLGSFCALMQVHIIRIYIYNWISVLLVADCVFDIVSEYSSMYVSTGPIIAVTRQTPPVHDMLHRTFDEAHEPQMHDSSPRWHTYLCMCRMPCIRLDSSSKKLTCMSSKGIVLVPPNMKCSQTHLSSRAEKIADGASPGKSSCQI
jgi:hypothetical protein